MGKIEENEGFKDDKWLTVVRDEGEAELGLVGGYLGVVWHDFGVGMDLRQQLISNIRALYKIGLSWHMSAWGSEMPQQST